MSCQKTNAPLPSTATAKKKGRTSPVDLADTGTMLGLLDFNATGGASGKVYVRAGGSPNRAAVAAAHHHGQGVPQREWLGVSPSSMKVLNRKTLIYAESALALMNAGEGGFVKQGPKAFTKKGATVWVNTGHAKSLAPPPTPSK